MAEAQELGIIGQTTEDGFAVVFKFVDELPSQQDRERLPWLTVISWKYDGSSRNGMPPESVNQQMIALERAINELESAVLCRHAYSRTGNGLKELVYYISDQDEFMNAFNDALREHPRYPIEITFYEDQQWGDFQKFRERFNRE
jgi:hypothetical protein